MLTKTVYAESSFCSGFVDYCCLSSDTPPLEGVAENSLLLVLDTKKFYYFTDGEWVELGTAPESSDDEGGGTLE